MLSDVLMPGVDGFRLCHVLRALPGLGELPVVLASAAYDDEEDRRVGRLADATALVVKTPDFGDALAALATALEGSAPVPPRQPDELVVHEHAERLMRQVERQAEANTNLARQAAVQAAQLSVLAERVGDYSAIIGRHAGLDIDRCELLRQASVVHDVGKLGIPDSILRKRGPLDAAERTAMQRHAEYGHAILAGSGLDMLEMAASIALTHHERWDGTGYPLGLRGEDIPLEGRIVAIADVFDALTSDRVYRAALPVQRAVTILEDGRGAHFDPRLLDCFTAAFDEIEAARRRNPDEAPAAVA